MKRTAPEAAQDLVEAIGSAQSVFALQAQNAQAARQNAEATQNAFVSSLTAYQSQGGSPSLQEFRQALLRNRPQNDPLAETTALSRQWVLALSDSQTALMRLYAFPNAQEETERIADLLRQLQLLQVDSPRVEPPAVTPMPGGEAAPDDEQERRRMKAGMAADFMQGMTKHLETVREAYQTQSDRTTALLAEMQQGATALLHRLNG